MGWLIFPFFFLLCIMFIVFMVILLFVVCIRNMGDDPIPWLTIHTNDHSMRQEVFESYFPVEYWPSTWDDGIGIIQLDSCIVITVYS
jgi:hypothetical protein